MPNEVKHLVLRSEGCLLPGTRFFVAPLLRMTSDSNLSFRVSRETATEKSLRCPLKVPSVELNPIPRCLTYESSRRRDFSLFQGFEITT